METHDGVTRRGLENVRQRLGNVSLVSVSLVSASLVSASLVVAFGLAISLVAMPSAATALEGFVNPGAPSEEQLESGTQPLGPVLPALTDPFAITVNFGAGLTPSQQAVFGTAADTWDAVIDGYQPGIGINGPVISASAPFIDGPGGILGSAGPTFVTTQGGFTVTTQGEMEFDSADVANLEANGTLLDVILHEMGHVLGIGTLWDFGANNVYVDGSGEYTGASGLAAYQSEFNQPAATFVPVELGGGGGTADGHWNEVNGGGSGTGIVSNISGQDMRFELMTGWLNAPTFMSSLTVQSLADIGFDVVATSFVPEDLNMDGFVDGQDLGILLGNWDLNVTPAGGELDGTPPVAGPDLGLLLAAWNPALPLASVVAVPEPTSGVLVVVGMLALALPLARRWPNR